jgi:hypothetical protein
MLVWDAFGALRQTPNFKFQISDFKFQIPDSKKSWRRGWDSNPRNGSPFTAFPVLPIQPLLHLSPGRISDCELQIAELRKQQLEPQEDSCQKQIRNPKSSHPLMPRRETISLY